MRSGCAIILGFLLLIAGYFVPNPQEIERHLGVELPADATNIRFEHQSAFMMSIYWLRFDTRDAIPFLESLELDSVIEEGVNPFAEHDYQVPWWWDADEQQNVRGGIYEQRGDAMPKRDFVVMLSELDGGMVRVYLMVIDDV
jgi:hypothetical protein